jgi:hypothetical protein
MPLHISSVEVAEIQIWFEYKLVCNLQKGLKIYKGFSIFSSLMGRNLLAALTASSHAWPDRPNKPAPVAHPA